MKNFSQLKKNLNQVFSELPEVKAAVLGDSATQFLCQAIKGQGYEQKLNITIWEADFDQIDRQILDPTSDLYSFEPEVIVIFQSTHKLLGKFNKKNPSEQSNLAATVLENTAHLVSAIKAKCNAKIVHYNFNEIDDTVFGNFSTKTVSSFLYQVRKLNLGLMDYAMSESSFYICDLSSIQNKIGKDSFFQPSIYVNTEMVLSLDALPWIANRTVDLFKVFKGKIKKCVIIDLDNTTWGGVIGDDGVEKIQIGALGIGKAFTEFQYWIKKLKNRGIIVAVCSKNTESVAIEPFEKHPDMVLRMEDISVFKANWENKADNIRSIQQILNIGFDSMVFIDDNPFERNIVRENLPDVLVPELPEDPAEYLEYLYGLNLFETISYSKEDADRTKLYQTEAKRVSVQQKFTNEEEFLESLEMVSDVQPFNTFNTPRVAQLTQRSNQYNLRTKRYTEADLEHVASSDKFSTFAFTLEDKFGDSGIICVVILEHETSETLFVDTWLMSCRVLKRGMELFVINQLVNHAMQNGYKQIKGEYIPSAKNQMVKNHYENLGFEQNEGYWLLNISNFEKKKNYIKRK
ncbi:MAG: HAD-IIIC family phosphatase [Flavobacteriales bacterium]|nr:HAD-IIIC family phosphatase [Flavobacteriales bacterium]